MLEPIAQGDRGAAVEDVQKRLLVLGFDLGPTGVDGVFLGATLSAVRSFQHANGLSEDGTVGDETWAALVDATFRLGDRLLYLRYPYLHGADVRALQSALNVLGFACGSPDGIFGAFTERAVRTFPRQPEFYAEQGMVLCAMNRLMEADREFARALDLFEQESADLHEYTYMRAAAD